ncbi:MAG TPA: serine hydrolase domain-containing protein [Pseudonocardia sp.]|nr:serine hydrolase domain-containing protein [Pseudonocardia sp.]
MRAPEIHGSVTSRFEPVRDALQAQLASGEELGASIYIDIDGEPVVDIWGGHRDEARSVEWTEDTITNVWSSTKTVSALATLMLVDRGLLDVYAPVARYWPEFAANGKEAVEVRHILSHTSGVSGWQSPVTYDDIYDWEGSTSRLAAQPPWWEPGSASGYHALNLGHLLGELVRRVSGKTLKQFVAEEIAGPLGADFQIGAREQDWGRIANVVPPPPFPFDMSALDPNSPMMKTLGGLPPTAEVANTEGWRRADIGAANGHGNARSVARMLSAIALDGEVDGVALLSPKTIDLIFEEQADGMDLVIPTPLRWGIGFGLPQTDTLPYIPDERICFWGGWGGSMIVMDLGRRMTVSYMMNKMGMGTIGSERAELYLRTVYGCV